MNNWDIDRCQAKFRQHKKDFEELVTLLKSQNIRIGHSINKQELPENVQNIIDRLKEYQFESSWCGKASLYFSKDSCIFSNIGRKYHAMESKMIEVWAMEDGWIMWIDYDFI